MKRVLAALFIVFAAIGPAAAQTSSERQAVLDVQALLADVGRWQRDYQAVMTQASQPMTDIQSYISILDRFQAGEIRQRRARADIDAWRTRSLETVLQARSAAEALREPPSLALLGPSAANLERAMHGARDNLLPIIAEFERIVNACAELGFESLSDSSKGLEARQRTLINAQMQLIRVDLGRIELAGAALASTHPTHHVAIATQHYYAAMLAVAQFAIAELDGGGDRAALIASLRTSAQDMRASLDRSSTLTEQMRAQLRAALGGPGVEIARTGLQVFETYPPTIAAYRALAENINRAATALEGGAETLVVWGDQEEWDMPHLNEIDRLDRVRADLLANNAGAL